MRWEHAHRSPRTCIVAKTPRPPTPERRDPVGQRGCHCVVGERVAAARRSRPGSRSRMVERCRVRGMAEAMGPFPRHVPCGKRAACGASVRKADAGNGRRARPRGRWAEVSTPSWRWKECDAAMSVELRASSFELSGATKPQENTKSHGLDGWYGAVRSRKTAVPARQFQRKEKKRCEETDEASVWRMLRISGKEGTKQLGLYVERAVEMT